MGITESSLTEWHNDYIIDIVTDWRARWNAHIQRVS